MILWHYFDVSTGVLEGRTYKASDGTRPPKIEGMDVIVGVTDWQSQRVDVTVTPWALIDYQPPRPDADHHWDTESKRWRQDPIKLARKQREIEILSEIKGIDDRIIRPIVELSINPEDVAARLIRDKLVAEKARLRAELKALTETA